MSRSRLAPALLFALLPAAGCAIGVQKEGRVIDPALVAQIDPGVTTKQQILDAFGPPTYQSRVGNGRTGQDAAPWAGQLGQGGSTSSVTIVWDGVVEDIYTYEYVENEETFVSLLVYTYWGRTTLADTLMVVFTSDDKVKYSAFSKQTEALPEPEEGKEGQE